MLVKPGVSVGPAKNNNYCIITFLAELLSVSILKKMIAGANYHGSVVSEFIK